MGAQLRLLLFFYLIALVGIMGPLICIGCNSKPFRAEIGLRRHQLSCDDFIATLGQNITPAVPTIAAPPAQILHRDDESPEEERQHLRDTLNEPFELPHASTSHVELPPSRISGRKRRAPPALKDYVPSSTAGRLSEHVSQFVPPPPPGPPPQPLVEDTLEELPNPADPAASPPEPRVTFETEPNGFGVFRRYYKQPERDPELQLSSDGLCNSPTITSPPSNPAVGNNGPAHGFGRAAVAAVTDAAHRWFAPFLNASVFRLLHWCYSGSNIKSAAELNRLVNDVLLADDFCLDDLRGGFSVQREEERLDALDQPKKPANSSHGTSPAAPSLTDGWREGKVKLRVPKEKFKHACEAAAPEMEVDGLYYRPLLEVIRAAYEDPSAAEFEFTPYELHHRDEDDETDRTAGSSTATERLYTEAYTADAILEENARIQSLPRVEGDDDDIPYTVAPLMFWSDSTHLANFGTASLWPIYLFFGSLSKYVRCKPTSFAAHHLAYVPKLPDTVQDFYQSVYGCLASANVIKFLKSEVMHAVWLLLLDADFMNAYEHGVIIMCGDGLRRRIFPRIFTYSADYPERVLLSCIRYLAGAPCPACLTQKAHIVSLGTKADTQRRSKLRMDTSWLWDKIEMCRSWIFERGYGVGSKMVDNVLGALSLLPTRSAFSIRLSPFGFNHYSMFAPDVLHEYEIGTWKHVFIHLLRVIYEVAANDLGEFNARFRAVPTFGRSTIRRFHSNVSAMKKLAARDFEDILQCIIPCIEGILPPSLEVVVLDMLWELALWHGLAKLRLHTDKTLQIFEATTTRLGTAVRRFARACASIATKELPKEVSARARRNARKSKGKEPSVAAERKRKYLNLKTFKWHAIGHLPSFIRRHGTSEGYSTQVGELEHRRVKAFYARTNKIRFAKQIASRTRRQRLLESISLKGIEHAKQEKAAAIQEALARRRASPASRTPSPGRHASPPRTPKKRGRPRKSSAISLGPTDKDPLPTTSYTAHHHISDSREHWTDLHQWLSENREDPALVSFMPLLKDHLISRLIGREYEGDETAYTAEERSKLYIRGDRLYRHKVMRINYTTYDMRRDQDSINPRTHPDIMVISQEDEGDGQRSKARHPYWYARVIGIFHADVKYMGPGSQSRDWERLEFLWIRWFGLDFTAPGGFRKRRLHRVGFVDADDGGAFGFLDPKVVLRAAHLIPAFAHGRRDDLLGPSLARQDDEDDEDYVYYYVNMFVDRDMLMRYLGGGIGHKATRKLVPIDDAFEAITGSAIGEQATEVEESDDTPTDQLEQDMEVVAPAPVADNASSGPIDEDDDGGERDNDNDEEEEDCEEEDEDEDDERVLEEIHQLEGEDDQEPAEDAMQTDDAVLRRSTRARRRPSRTVESWLGPEDGEDGVRVDDEFEWSI
ncbi:hypothetical protein PsYK624_086780 [Phanerochaete sordida]|uniref:Uncharacterized protein n=1 Tax=Phanerochaete sordida TaxID=48140 RepID=A0A9P3GF02_9APHY|nr:hypothetical protein PsYK624_086780 [Phanerochaete sordida]